MSYKDSNLDRQIQKLQCYHYTIRQFVCFCDSKLDDALKRYEYNMEAYLVSEYMQKLMSDLSTKEKAVFLGVISAEMYVYLSEKNGIW